MTRLVPTQLVTTKSSGPAMERSTWLSAAKWTTASSPLHGHDQGIEVADVGVDEAVAIAGPWPPTSVSVDRLPA